MLHATHYQHSCNQPSVEVCDRPCCSVFLNSISSLKPFVFSLSLKPVAHLVIVSGRESCGLDTSGVELGAAIWHDCHYRVPRASLYCPVFRCSNQPPQVLTDGPTRATFSDPLLPSSLVVYHNSILLPSQRIPFSILLTCLVCRGPRVLKGPRPVPSLRCSFS